MVFGFRMFEYRSRKRKDMGDQEQRYSHAHFEHHELPFFETDIVGINRANQADAQGFEFLYLEDQFV